MNKLLLLLSFCACMSVLSQQSLARERKIKDKTEKKDSINKKVTPYDELFKENNKHTFSKGLISIHRYDEKLYLEIPLNLLGRDFLLNSVIEGSSDIALIGTIAANPQHIIIEKTDSLVLFRSPKFNIRINEKDYNQNEAFRLSNSSPIIKAFPIKAFNNDSTAIVFDATSYFNGSNKDLFDIKGRSFGDMLMISDFSTQSNASYIDRFQAFDNSISIKLINSVKLSLNIMGFEVTEKPEITLAVQTVLTLLPIEKMKTREADPRVGTNYVSYMDYRNVNHPKEGYYITRRKLNEQQPVIFYVDTLISKNWIDAIQKSADAWNKVFDKSGAGRPIVLKPYRKDSIFQPENPMINCIAFINNNKSNVTAYNITDLRTGEILSTKIGIPRDLAAAVRKKGVYQMADVDERFRTYFIPDDLVCEALGAYMLKAFGISLGLANNLAGSMAYSPDQLRSPEFTHEYGISASVMDDVFYNYLAQPGDKEKGVVLVSNKPGICDEFTLKYMYAPIPEGKENEILKKWVMEHDGDPRYFFGKATPALASDPRCQKNDLGNDPFAAIDAKINHLKYVVKHSAEWLKNDAIPREYKELFPDFVFIEWYNNSLTTLLPYIGGVYLNESYKGSKLPPYLPVPADTQKKVIKKVFDICKDLTWMDANREFLYLGGANTSMSEWVYMNGVPVNGLLFRLSKMGLSVNKSASPYTQKALLADIEKNLFAEVRAGKALPEHKVVQVAGYIGNLITLSPTLKAIQKTKIGSNQILLTNIKNDFRSTLYSCYRNTDSELNNINSSTSAMDPLSSIYYYSDTDIENICYEKLNSTYYYLMQAKKLAPNEIEREKCNFLIMQVNRVLDKK